MLQMCYSDHWTIIIFVIFLHSLNYKLYILVRQPKLKIQRITFSARGVGPPPAPYVASPLILRVNKHYTYNFISKSVTNKNCWGKNNITNIDRWLKNTSTLMFH